MHSSFLSKLLIVIDKETFYQLFHDNQIRMRPSLDQTESGTLNSQLSTEEASLKRLDFSQEIRNADLPDKRKEELLEFDDRTRMLRIVNAFTDEQVDR